MYLGICFKDSTAMLRFACDCRVDKQSMVLYVSGRAGPGNLTIALLTLQHFHQRIQYCATTGHAASIFNGPTIHSAMECSLRGSCLAISNKMAETRVFYENVDDFFRLGECAVLQ